MKEPLAAAYANMYGVFGTLGRLCELDGDAKSVLDKLNKPVALCFEVGGGPCATLFFDKNGCELRGGEEGCTCKMSFASPEKFNDMFDKSNIGTPSKNPLQLFPFLINTFAPLAKRMEALLRADESELSSKRALYELNTRLTLCVVANSIAALANNDSQCKKKAAALRDGDVLFAIRGSDAFILSVSNRMISSHVFAGTDSRTEISAASVIFTDFDAAHSTFAGGSAEKQLQSGNIILSGAAETTGGIMRILDRVSLYLK